MQSPINSQSTQNAANQIPITSHYRKPQHNSLSLFSRYRPAKETISESPHKAFGIMYSLHTKAIVDCGSTAFNFMYYVHNRHHCKWSGNRWIHTLSEFCPRVGQLGAPDKGQENCARILDARLARWWSSSHTQGHRQIRLVCKSGTKPRTYPRNVWTVQIDIYIRLMGGGKMKGIVLQCCALNGVAYKDDDGLCFVWRSNDALASIGLVLCVVLVRGKIE